MTWNTFWDVVSVVVGVVVLSVIIAGLVAVMLPLFDHSDIASTDNISPETGCVAFPADWRPVTAYGQGGHTYFCQWRGANIYAACSPEPVPCPE